MQLYFRHAQLIIDSYAGEIPLQHYLRQYFSRNAKLGSRDRKALSEMLYSWYRASKVISGDISFDEKIKASLMLCEAKVPAARKLLPEQWQAASTSILEKKSTLESSDITVDLDRLLPAGMQFSDGIDRDEWVQSILHQPRLFLRIRGPQSKAEALLLDANVSFEWITPTCLALPNGTKVEGLLPEDMYVVQDASSQATGQFLKPIRGQSWWDVCCGAGGKSLLLCDAEPTVKLSSSDIRNSILHNLRERFKRYGLKAPQTFKVDATDSTDIAAKLGGESFDAIIADVPCSGSGTWARTPEQLYFFREETIEEYSRRQVLIASNAAKCLRSGGRLIYLTCSVFSKENEMVVDQIVAASGMRIEEQRLINGTAIAADSLFGAVLIKDK